jgi:hypothetical protein
MGGPAWFSDDDTRDALVETMEAADRTGRLRDILDTIRSHPVEDHYSGHWSYAREEFERRLYCKRRRVTVKFVELTAAIPVQGPANVVLDNLVTNNSLALLNARTAGR